jgi:uncharacterized membrane protein
MSDVTVAGGVSVRSRATDRRLAVGSATIAAGLAAGLFYGFVCAVMPGLRHSSDRSFIDAMQHINTSIENPLFFATFLGTPALIGWSYWLERRAGDKGIARLLICALALFGIGLVTTGAINIPLNNDLEAAGPAASVADPHAVREHFESTWVIWNVVRAVVFTASFMVLSRALLLLQGRR